MDELFSELTQRNRKKKTAGFRPAVIMARPQQAAGERARLLVRQFPAVRATPQA